MPVHVFTSAAANYLPKARVLASSLRKYAPNIHLSLLLAEPKETAILAEAGEFDEIVTIEDIGIDNLSSWLFQHDLVETCTAIKSFYLCQLLERPDCDAVIYFDPDIAVFSSLQQTIETLKNCSIMLTPHLLKHELSPEAVTDNELCTLKYGAYNLGFLGVNNCPEGKRFARWWRDRLQDYCFNDTANNLFTDQRWADLVPAMFEQVHISRDCSLNVATWNLTHRRVDGDFSSGFTVNDRPLVFYHFSGIDSGNQLLMLQKYGRDMPSLWILRDWYLAQCKQHSVSSQPLPKWHFGRYDNGIEITAQQRKIYKENRVLHAKFPDPFKSEGSCYLNFFQAENDSLASRLNAHVPEPISQTALHETEEANDLLYFPIFDPEYYLETYPEVAQSGSDPYVHYVLSGIGECKNPGPLFNTAFYIQMVNETEALFNPLAHFLSYGWQNSLNPHPLFDMDFYFSQSADVRAAGINPLSHFITDGWRQMRDPHPLFDVSYYLEQNPDVKHAGLNPLAHFIRTGAFEKRNPHPLFDTKYYLEEHPEAANALETPLEHFINTVARLASNPHPLFDCSYYLCQLPECEKEQARKNPLLHFLRAENSCFDPHPAFDVDFYRKQNPDVLASGINPLLHYVMYGKAEGRRPTSQSQEATVKSSKGVERICDLKLAALKKAAKTDEKPTVLFVGQANPGGTHTHIADLCRMFDSRISILMLRPSPSAVSSKVELSFLHSSANEVEASHQVDFEIEQQFDELTEFLRILNVSRLHVHSLKENEHYLKRLIDKLGVPFDFTLHDYYVLSPLLHLTDEAGNFAGEPDEGNAASNLSVISSNSYQSEESVSIETMAAWRARHAWLIESAERIIAPSLDTKQRFRHHYPEKSVLAAYHPGALASRTPVKAKPLASENFLKVLVTGQIGNHKGAAMLESCAQLSREKQLPISFELLGSSSYPLTTYPNTELTVHGRYQLEELPALIASINPHLCWFPGQCAETYSYTFSEVCALGLPVLVPAVGALPERAAGRPWSFVAPLTMRCEEWLDLLIHIRNNHFLTGIAPEPYMSGSICASFDFYEKQYLSWVSFQSESEFESEFVSSQPMAFLGEMK